MKLRRIVGGLVNDQINSRPLMRNRQINDRDELRRVKEELNDSLGYNPTIGLDHQIS
jgi:hypothetical protein